MKLNLSPVQDRQVIQTNWWGTDGCKLRPSCRCFVLCCYERSRDFADSFKHDNQAKLLSSFPGTSVNNHYFDSMAKQINLPNYS